MATVYSAFYILKKWWSCSFLEFVPCKNDVLVDEILRMEMVKNGSIDNWLKGQLVIKQLLIELVGQ